MTVLSERAAEYVHLVDELRAVRREIGGDDPLPAPYGTTHCERLAALWLAMSETEQSDVVLILSEPQRATSKDPEALDDPEAIRAELRATNRELKKLCKPSG